MADLIDVARRIFHARSDDERGAILAEVGYDDLPELSEILQGMEARRVAFLDQADATVTEYGYVIQGVFGSEHSPWFAYSVGLWPDHGAEFIVRGFGSQTPEVAGRVAEWVASGALPLAPGEHLVDGLRLRVEAWRGDQIGRAHV